LRSVVHIWQETPRVCYFVEISESDTPNGQNEIQVAHQSDLKLYSRSNPPLQGYLEIARTLNVLEQRMVEACKWDFASGNCKTTVAYWA